MPRYRYPSGFDYQSPWSDFMNNFLPQYTRMLMQKKEAEEERKLRMQEAREERDFREQEAREERDFREQEAIKNRVLSQQQIAIQKQQANAQELNAKTTANRQEFAEELGNKQLMLEYMQGEKAKIEGIIYDPLRWEGLSPEMQQSMLAKVETLKKAELKVLGPEAESLVAPVQPPTAKPGLTPGDVKSLSTLRRKAYKKIVSNLKEEGSDALVPLITTEKIDSWLQNHPEFAQGIITPETEMKRKQAAVESAEARKTKKEEHLELLSRFYPYRIIPHRIE